MVKSARGAERDRRRIFERAFDGVIEARVGVADAVGELLRPLEAVRNAVVLYPREEIIDVFRGVRRQKVFARIGLPAGDLVEIGI